MDSQEDQRISETVQSERSRLRNFIRRRVPDYADAEDILQDVFCELVEAYYLLKPIEQVGAWLFRVARNRITDFLRKKKPEALLDQRSVSEEGDVLTLEEMLPSSEAGPYTAYASAAILEEFYSALNELPAEQRAIFIAHVIEGRSFRDISAEGGINVNTLLSRKRYAVIHLRERLRDLYEAMP